MSLVAICAERSLDMVVGLLEDLEGRRRLHLPIDPDYPQERLGVHACGRDTFGAARPGSTWRHVSPAISGTIVRGLDVDNVTHSSEETRLPSAVTGQHLAYVIYTSGSTGQPKGAMTTHGGIVNPLAWMQDAYALTHADVVLQKTPFTIDVSVWEFFWPLTRGARLVMARPGGQGRPRPISSRPSRSRRLRLCISCPRCCRRFSKGATSRSRCRSLRRVICSGEALSSELARRFFASRLAGGSSQSVRSHRGGGGRRVLAMRTRVGAASDSARSAHRKSPAVRAGRPARRGGSDRRGRRALHRRRRSRAWLSEAIDAHCGALRSQSIFGERRREDVSHGRSRPLAVRCARSEFSGTHRSPGKL